MVKKSLLTALIMLVLYQLVLPYLPRKYALDQARQQGNILKAEEFLFSSPKPNQIVVGSSLSALLDPSLVGNGCCNLAFSGGSALTGLELLTRSAAKPGLVLIEINNLDRKVDQPFIENLFNPVFFKLRRRVSMFRECNRPANFVAGIEARMINLGHASYKRLRPSHSKADSAAAGHGAEPQGRGGRVAPAAALEETRRWFAQAPSTTLLEANLAQLEKDIHTLQSRGCTVVFYEMPVDPEFVGSAFATAIRNATTSRFPGPVFHWVQEDNSFHYETTDGVHLSRPSATHFARFLAGKAAEMLSECRPTEVNHSAPAE